MPEVNLVLGDWLDVLPTIEDDSYDSVITDPPYGVEYASWDSDIPPQRFLDECLRISRGPVIMFGAATMILEFAYYEPKPDRVLIWAPKFTLSHTMGMGLAYRYHPIFIWRPTKPKDKAITWDVLQDNTECGNWWKHTATKPLSLMLKLVQAFGGDSVLDPFVGSGTTLVACVESGKIGLGIDNDPNSIAIAEKRISDAQQQLQLVAAS